MGPSSVTSRGDRSMKEGEMSRGKEYRFDREMSKFKEKFWDSESSTGKSSARVILERRHYPEESEKIWRLVRGKRVEA